MPATVRIKSIKKQHVLSDVEFLYILNHLNEDLPIMSLNYCDEGKLFYVTVYADDFNCIVLFVDANEIGMEVVINGKCIN